MSVVDPGKLASIILRSLREFLLKARTLILSVLLGAGVCVSGYWAWSLYDALSANRAIVRLKGGEDIAVDPKAAHGEVLLARLRLLLAQDRKEEAQILVDASQASAQEARARMLYMLGNARVRTAMALIEKGNLDRAIPEVRLAKEAYRASLRLDPDFWDSKHNFDVAMRLVRDLPAGDQEGEEVPPDAPKRLWTDLPGVPQGAP